MNRKTFRIFLQIAAFLVPFSMIYYGPLHEEPGYPGNKSIWKAIIAGFCFYTLAAIVLTFCR